MSLQDLGALGEMIGGFAVVVSLIYVAYQVRQSSRQIELNSRHIQASMYHATNDDFYRWFSLVAQDKELASLWLRGLQSEALSPEEKLRFNSLASMLFLSYENNFEQLKLGTMQRKTFEIAREEIGRLLSRPAIKAWWDHQATISLTPEFREALESLVTAEESDDGDAA